MDSLSHNILSVLLTFSVLFSKPSWQKALTLLLGAIICTGKRTVCAALRAMGLSHQKEQVAFSDMLRAVRMVIWKDNLILRKANNTSPLENITPEMAQWAQAIVKQMLQAA